MWIDLIAWVFEGGIDLTFARVALLDVLFESEIDLTFVWIGSIAYVL